MFDIIIKELHTHTCDVDVLLNRIVALETNLKEAIMNAKTEILATVSAEAQQVLDKINADRAELDVAQAALATAQAQLVADQAELAAKVAQIADLQAQIDALTAGGNTLSDADLVEITSAIKNIINPVVETPVE